MVHIPAPEVIAQLRSELGQVSSLQGWEALTKQYAQELFTEESMLFQYIGEHFCDWMKSKNLGNRWFQILLSDCKCVQRLVWELAEEGTLLKTNTLRRGLKRYIWEAVEKIQDRATVRLLDENDCKRFIQALYEMRTFCIEHDMFWGDVDIRVDGGSNPMSRSIDGYPTSIILYRENQLRVYRGPARTRGRGFSRVYCPAGHHLRKRLKNAKRKRGAFHSDQFYLKRWT